jgi:acetylornithine deacetylase/succinyl-diaminopimelate desuccinylase-like protein
MSAEAHARIAQLAAQSSVHRAFRWFHLHQQQLRRWQIELLRIPAPPFQESARAAWFLERFRDIGLSNPHLDQVGNALAELSARGASKDAPVILLSAHLDTVFPPDTPIDIRESGPRLLAPGACDNGAGLSALLALAAAFRDAALVPPITILFAANVGEEGEGNLRGMRHLFTESPYSARIAAAIALEGAGNSSLVTRALASRRFRVTVTGPGGHSWIDAGALNPILLLARGLLALESLDLPSTEPRTTLNVGQITGGTSINSIPESATALLDLRSTGAAQLTAAENSLRNALTECILRKPYPQAVPAPAPFPTLNIELIGDRPAGSLPPGSPLLETIRAVDRHLHLRTDPGLGSTDANIPLSLGIPAVAIGTGGSSGGIHTLAEWYDPTGRDIALRRILLTLLDTAHLVQSASL